MVLLAGCGLGDGSCIEEFILTYAVLDRYYGPGRYCLLVVDGRQKDYSRGMFLTELSKLFESLGGKAAYNLDGGHCSFMVKDGAVVSHPYKPTKDVSDSILICEGKVGA